MPLHAVSDKTSRGFSWRSEDTFPATVTACPDAAAKQKQTNGITMKTNGTNKTITTLGTSAAVLLAFAAWLSGTANAQDQMPPKQRGEHQTMLNG